MTTTIKSFLFPQYKEQTALVFSSDNNYAAYLQVTLKSIVANSTTEHSYDIIILHSDDLDATMQAKIASLPLGKNFSLRFYDVSSYLCGQKFYVRAHYTKAMYYRLFVPDIFTHYQRVIYCDCDAVFNADPAKLYAIDLKDNYLGAVHDTEVIRQLYNHEIDTYYYNFLKLKNPNDYFQSCLLIYDIKAINKSDFKKNIIKTMKSLQNPQYPDQDILNVAAEGHVFFLDGTWNYEWHLWFFHDNLENKLPAHVYSDYLKNRAKPAFLHYSSHFKPWNFPYGRGAEYFWQYAKSTPVYEKLRREKCVWRKRYSLFNCLRCRLLSHITTGNKKHHYRQKYRQIARLHSQMHK